MGSASRTGSEAASSSFHVRSRFGCTATRFAGALDDEDVAARSALRARSSTVALRVMRLPAPVESVARDDDLGPGLLDTRHGSPQVRSR